MENLTNEIWKPIPSFEGFYSVSNKGRVKSETRTIFQQGRNQTYKGKILKTYISSTTGYPTVSLMKKGRELKIYVHRLVMWAFVGHQMKGIEVRHLDGTRTNNCLENLAYGTHSENMRDAVRHGTASCCRNNPNNIFKITEEQAVAIAKDTRITREIARDYGITPKHVNSIKRGEYWGDITRGCIVKAPRPEVHNKRHFTDEEIKFICDMTIPQKTIREKLNIKWSTIQRVRKENHIIS